MTSQIKFYKNVLSDFIPDKKKSILVCGAGVSDAKVFLDLQYTNVTMSGMDFTEGNTGDYTLVCENAESLSFADNSFDFCVMHASIHHTSLPHKVISELYRVSSQGVVFVESRDSFLIRLTQRLYLTEEYEVKGTYPGMGVNGTEFPNYIFRWTEREVMKTIKCFEPRYSHEFKFKYGSNFPDGKNSKRSIRLLLKFMYPLFKLFTAVFPKQQNLFAVFIKKQHDPERLKPWLKWDINERRIKVDRDYILNTYSKWY